MADLTDKYMTRNLNVLNLILTVILSLILISQFLTKSGDEKLLAMEKRVDSLEQQVIIAQKSHDEKLSEVQKRVDAIYNLLARRSLSE